MREATLARDSEPPVRELVDLRVPGNLGREGLEGRPFRRERIWGAFRFTLHLRSRLEAAEDVSCCGLTGKLPLISAIVAR